MLNHNNIVFFYFENAGIFLRLSFCMVLIPIPNINLNLFEKKSKSQIINPLHKKTNKIYSMAS